MSQQQKPRHTQVDLLLDPDASDAAFTRAVERLDAERRRKLVFIIEARIDAHQQARKGSSTEVNATNASNAQYERLKSILNDQVAPLNAALTRLEQIFYTYLTELYQNPAAAWHTCHLQLAEQAIPVIAGHFQADPAIFGALKGSGFFGGSNRHNGFLNAEDLTSLLQALTTARQDKTTLAQLGISL